MQTVGANRLVIFLTPLSTAECQPEVNLLRVFAQGGLLGRSVICQHAQLVQHRGQAAAASEDDGWRWTGQLSDVLNAAKITTLSVVSLRSAAMTAEDYRLEGGSLEAIKDLLPRDAERNVSQITVSPADVAHPRTEEAHSASWDCHLVCDPQSSPSKDLPQRFLDDATAAEARAQALLAGICASGGWVSHEDRYEVVDYHDGGLLPVRFCHASVRVVYAPHLDRIERSRFVPHRPPWPLPHGAGCEYAAPGAVPSWEMANQTADIMGLRCRKPTESPSRKKHRFRVWRKLSLPAAQAHEERSVHLFLSRLGITDPDVLIETLASRESSKLYVLEAMQEHGIEKVAADIERSGFRFPDGAAEANKPTPEAWNVLYQLCFSLVDGGTIPKGVDRPRSVTGGRRLVWLDGAPIAPEALTDPQPHEDDEAVVNADQDMPPPPSEDDQPEPTTTDDADNEAPPAEPDQPGFWAPDPDNPELRRWYDNYEGRWSDWYYIDGAVTHMDASAASAPETSEEQRRPTQNKSPKAHGSKRSDSTADAEAREDLLKAERPPDEMQAGKVAMGGSHDSLISRLSQILDSALQDSQDAFCKHAFVHDDEEDRYVAARVAQTKARKAAWLTGSLLAAVGAFGLDQRWPFVNEVWRLLLGTNAPLRLYNPTMLPWVPSLVGLVVAVVGGIYLLRKWGIFMMSAAKLDAANTNRHLNNALVLFYASELLRIRTLKRQFTDHVSVIRAMIHHPFGALAPLKASEAPDLSWYGTTVLPPGLLLASATTSDEITEEDQRRLQQVFRANWVNDAWHNARRVWKDQYDARIVSGYEEPEHDTAPYGTIQHRDRQTGEPVLGARSDWVEFALRTDPTGLTAVSKRWMEERLEEAARGTPEHFAVFLQNIKPFSEHVGWWNDASECLANGAEHHEFAWNVLLSDSAPTPAVSEFSPATVGIESASEGALMVLHRWELLISDPVRPDDLINWSAPAAPDRQHLTGNEIEDYI